MVSSNRMDPVDSANAGCHLSPDLTQIRTRVPTYFFIGLNDWIQNVVVRSPLCTMKFKGMTCVKTLATSCTTIAEGKQLQSFNHHRVASRDGPVLTLLLPDITFVSAPPYEVASNFIR